MSTFLNRCGAMIALAMALPGVALAKPVVTVSVGLPEIVIAPPFPVVVVRPACPGPNWVWVDPAWHYDAYGRRIFVEGRWVPRPVSVVRTVPVRGPVVHRTVVVRR